MSKLTRHLLASIDYKTVNLKRQANFYYIHSRLKSINELEMEIPVIDGPFVYPLVVKREGLREFLIERKIFVAQYWPRVLNMPAASSDEIYLSKYLIPLPIDQRYDLHDMQYMLKHIFDFLEL
jgi:hypothetical protein